MGFIAGLCMMMSGCAWDFNNPTADEYDVQIIGDSIFDLSGDIQDVLTDLSGKVYKDRSVSGEKIDGILTQYDRAARNANLKTVIADGGGNDILQGSADCESDPLTQDCINTIDYVADKMEVLLEDMYNDGVQDCVWLGYYHVKNSEAEKNEAMDYAYSLYPAIFADASLNNYGSGGAYAIDSRDDIVPSQIKSDDIHPTYEGSEILAGLIWGVMVAEDTYR
jgi:hypothetical protein